MVLPVRETHTTRINYLPASGIKPVFAVMSPTVDEAVKAVGGLMFDRAYHGWHVVVATPDGQDLRPLQILGAHTWHADVSALILSGAAWLRGVAMPGNMCAADGPWYAWVIESHRNPALDLRIWDTVAPAAEHGTTSRAHHRLSVAAQAFKLQALAALGDRNPRCDTTELFRRKPLTEQ